MSSNENRKCSKCKIPQARDRAVSYLRFPKAGKTNLLQARAWAIYCWPDQEWLSVAELQKLGKSHKVLCGRHFEATCYSEKNPKRLQKLSIPGTKDYIAKIKPKLRCELHLMINNSNIQECSGLWKRLPQLQDHDYINNIMNTSQLPSQFVEGQGVQIPCQGQEVEISCQRQELSVADPVTRTTEGQGVQIPCQGQEVEISCQRQELSVANPVTRTTEGQGVQIPCQGQEVEISCQRQELSVANPVTRTTEGQRVRITCQGQELSAANPVARTTEMKEIKIISPGQELPIEVPLAPATEFQAPSTSKSSRRNTILKPLNVKKVEELTPREQLLYKMCRSSIKKISNLKRTWRKKSKTNCISAIVEDANVKILANSRLSQHFLLLLESQIKNMKRKFKGRRYNLDAKIMALTLYKKSPACYRLLRGMNIALPCPSTLKKLLNRVPLKPGINTQIFAGLKSMADRQTCEENLCILSFDEMAIRKNLCYNPRLDYLEGFQDHGNHGRANQIASNALVFMVSGIRKKWKQPVAFYFSGKTVTSDRLSVIIKEVLEECFKAGLNVVGTVCDMSRVNIKALETCGSTTERPYFDCNGREIVTIFDPPHLLKCFRNLFLKYNVKCPMDLQVDGKIVKGIAKWEHIKRFYDCDKSNPNFVYAPLLTEIHINPNSQQKMRVKLAAQIFSWSVASGVLSLISSNILPAEATATATFLCKMDKLFDALNAETADLRRGKKYSTNITANSSHFELFSEMKGFIQNMEFIGCNGIPPSQRGWLHTMNAIERLWYNLNNVFKIKSLSTRRLNQDVLENCFGCIRYSCGSNVNPTVGQFISGIKTAIISNLRHSGNKRNCEDDDAELAVNLKNFLLSGDDKRTEMNEHEKFKELDDCVIAEAIESVEQASAEAQACAYVCGFIIKRRNTNCNVCKHVFMSETDLEPIHVFTNMKEYQPMNNSLKYPNKDMVLSVETSASLINEYLKMKAWTDNLKQNIVSEILNAVDLTYLNRCERHLSENVSFIQNSVFYISLKRYSILKNRAFKDDDHKKALRRKVNILKNK